MRFRIPALLLFISLYSIAKSQSTIDTTIRSVFRSQLSLTDKKNKRDDLFLLGKVWGFLKYYHPTIASGKYNWDKELIQFLPGYLKIKNKEERSDSLLAWINRHGSVTENNCNDSILKNAKLKPDLSWINETNFSEQLVHDLKFIEKNRIQENQYYIKHLKENDVNISVFQHEDACYMMPYPSDSYALLSLYRFWNAIEYWYPYKYNLPLSWDSVLLKFIPKFLSHETTNDYTLNVAELIASLKDGHGYFKSLKSDEAIGKYYLPCTVKLIQQKLFVTSILNDSLCKKSDIYVGDIIESINYESIPELIQRLKPYCSASNTSSFYQALSYWITRTSKPQSFLSIRRRNLFVNTMSYNFIPDPFHPVYLNPPYFSYSKDSSFFLIKDKMGYINVGNFKRKDSLLLRSFIAKTKGLIIDNRQNQDERNGTGGGDIIASAILSLDNDFVKFSTAQPKYPGVFTFTKPTNMNTKTDKDYYKGSIAILVNEKTMSVGEFLTMAFRKAPDSKVIGTTTAGADGNTTYITLPGGIISFFTGLGVYYPDGTETQRIGIVPDITIAQTLTGYQNNKDEQLEKAIEYLSKKIK